MKTFLYNLKHFALALKQHGSNLINIIGAILLPIKPLMVLIGLMIFLDTITGLIKARKLKEDITSRRLSAVISKLVLYQVGIITFYCLDNWMLGEIVGAFTSIPILLTKIVAVFICGVELVSINENVTIITGVNYFKKFRKMLFRARELKKEFNEIAESPDDNVLID